MFYFHDFLVEALDPWVCATALHERPGNNSKLRVGALYAGGLNSGWGWYAGRGTQAKSMLSVAKMIWIS